MDIEDLLNSHCVEQAKGTPPLPAAEVEECLKLVPGWSLTEDGKAIRLKQRFAGGFASVVEFVDRIKDIAEAEDHHPDLRIYSYRWLDLDFGTHSIGGLSKNDFIMAARVNRLLAETQAT